MHAALPKGIFFDRLITADDTVTEFGWRSNAIVDGCRQLLAAFMLGDGPSGITFLSLGRGDPSWDETAPPPPTATTQTLVDTSPTRFAVTGSEIEIGYLDAMGAIISAVTNRIELTATLGPGSLPVPSGETSYPLREFGLFGRLGSSDFMINYVRHPVINIAADATFERRIRLVF